MIKYVLFDLDGTLLSTLHTITYHLNNALEAKGLKKIDISDTKRFIGNGAKKLVARAVKNSGIEDENIVLEVLTAYNRAYDNDPLPDTVPYEGIVELVDELVSKGVKLAVVTNKPDDTAKKLIDHFFPGKFSIVSGGRSDIVLKPDPNEALRVLYSVGGDASQCAFIGDTSVDILTGRNMYARLSIGVSWGFRSREELIDAGADRIADNAGELMDILSEVI